MLLSSSSYHASADEKSSNSIQATVFHQREFYSGLLDVIVTPFAVRMNFPDRKSYIVSRAPDWRVVMYNSDNNVGMEMPLPAYLTHVPHWNAVDNSYIANVPGEKIGPIQYEGLNCIRFGHVFVRRDGTVDPQNRYDSEVYITQQKDFPKQACQIDGKFVRDIALPGIAVFKRVRAEASKKLSGQELSSALSSFHTRSILLETKKVEQKEFPANYFDYPAKFKKVTRECDVMAMLSKKDQVDLFDVLGK